MATGQVPASQSLGLEGKVALVTGATRGLGLAIARKLCASGAHVVLNYAHSDADAEQALKELTDLPGSATAVRADVTDAGEMEQLLAEVRQRHGGLDALVHNAGSWRPSAAVGAEPAALRADMTLAVDPLLHAVPAVAGLMAGRPGRIVAISSSGARSTIPHYVGPGMAKAALESLVRYLAVELAGRGIAVNAVSTAKVDKGPGAGDPQVVAALAARTPAGRLTRPEDIADTVALLCTAEAGWIHGQVLTADGGLGLR